MKKDKGSAFLTYLLQRQKSLASMPPARPLPRNRYPSAYRQARRYAASNRSDPFAFGRKLLHLKNGIDDLLVA